MSQSKHTGGTDMTTERPDGTQGDLESPEAPAEALRQQIEDAVHKTYKHSDTTYLLETIAADEIMELVTAYAATVEREGRIDENEQELKLHMDVTNSMYVKGFNDAVDQLIAYRDIRLAALQGPIQGDAPDHSETAQP